MNRLLSIQLDSTVCFTLSLHRNCRHVATCVDRALLIFAIDFNAESPVYRRVELAAQYISMAKFIDDKHIVFCSGDGHLYVYNFLEEALLAKVASPKRSDILCADHAVLDVSQRNLVCMATLSGDILVYDISDILSADFEIWSDAQAHEQPQAVLVQRMVGQFGAEISCLSMSADGRFIAVGSEDNTYNIYSLSVQRESEDVRWVLLS